MRKKRVLLLSEGFGTGHTQAAHALEKGLKQLYPDVNARVIELGKILNPMLAPFILGAYRKTVTSTPRLIGLIYRSQNKRLNGFRRLALHRLFYSHTSKVITQLNPDVVICTHPFPSAIISRLKRQGLDIPLYTLITDYDAHGAWISPEVNQFLVSTPKVGSMLRQKQVEPCRIQVTGIPIHPDFWKEQSKQEAREELQLKALPTVMIMGGGWGLPLTDQLMEQMASWADKIQLLFCLGNNEKLIHRLKGSPLYQHPHIRILGYTNEISKLMNVADLLVTKPGGMTCTEGMAKGLPMFFAPPLPGQEEENCEYFVESGFGVVLKDSRTLDEHFIRLTTRFSETERGTAISRPEEYDPEICTRTVYKLLTQHASSTEEEMILNIR
ncbi:glycosyltransferase [Paenibacillus sp. Marseille-Q4541]|uniref:MGDG synthase family glycosyltransferase n=1 Tax=Paenibacillus sp. Marseille-Q4541 TaxID=2831522 RepID=UPI001BADC2B9|nr:glycosyltransferase [Paenibacillus sp. Marseille-Q4541]